TGQSVFMSAAISEGDGIRYSGTWPSHMITCQSAIPAMVIKTAGPYRVRYDRGLADPPFLTMARLCFGLVSSFVAPVMPRAPPVPAPSATRPQGLPRPRASTRRADDSP